MARIIILLAVLAGVVIMAFTTNVLDVFAPVVNSGSAVVAVAFVAALFIYRRLQAGKNKKDGTGR